MKRMRRRTAGPSESQEQKALFQWAALAEQKYPELRLMHHVPNGGLRDARTAVNLKREGDKRGVPDISLPVPRGKYHGLYIEMKVGKNKLTKEQQQWFKSLEEEGYATHVCYSWLEAREVIEKYLSEPRNFMFLGIDLAKGDDKIVRTNLHI